MEKLCGYEEKFGRIDSWLNVIVNIWFISSQLNPIALTHWFKTKINLIMPYTSWRFLLLISPGPHDGSSPMKQRPTQVGPRSIKFTVRTKGQNDEKPIELEIEIKDQVKPCLYRTKWKQNRDGNWTYFLYYRVKYRRSSISVEIGSCQIRNIEDCLYCFSNHI